jgi:hypothetical protein
MVGAVRVFTVNDDARDQRLRRPDGSDPNVGIAGHDAVGTRPAIGLRTP